MADVKPEMDQYASVPALTTMVEWMEIVDIVSANWQMMLGTS
jgi:hypothetical protein